MTKNEQEWVNQLRVSLAMATVACLVVLISAMSGCYERPPNYEDMIRQLAEMEFQEVEPFPALSTIERAAGPESEPVQDRMTLVEVSWFSRIYRDPENLAERSFPHAVLAKGDSSAVVLAPLSAYDYLCSALFQWEFSQTNPQPEEPQ